MSTKQKANKSQGSSRSLRFLLLWILLAWALCSLGFRYILSDLSRYTNQLEQLVSENTELDLKVGDLSGRWMLISPVIEARNLRVFQHKNGKNSEESGLLNKNPVMEIKHVALELDMMASLFSLSPRIKRLLINGLAIELEVNAETGKIGVPGMVLQTVENPVKNLEKLLNQYVLASEQVVMLDSNITLSFPEQEKLGLNVHHVKLNNAWMNHTLNMKFDLEDASELSRAVNFNAVFDGSPLRLDTFSSRAFISIEAGELEHWLEKKLLTNSVVSLHSGELAVKAWLDIRKGVLERLSLHTDIQDLAFSPLKVHEVREKNVSSTANKDSNDKSHTTEASIVSPEISKQLIKKLAFNAEIVASVDLLQLNKTEYIKNLAQQETDIKVSELALHWNEVFLDDFRLVFSQIKGSTPENPLANSWNQVINSSESQYELLIQRMAVSHLPLGLLHNVSTLTPALWTQKDLLEKLSPVGSLKQIQVVATDILDKDLSFESNIYMSALASDIGIASLEKVPAIEGVDFYMEYAPKVLGIELDAKNVVLRKHAQLFRDDLNIDSMKSNLLLEVLPGDIVIHSDLATINTEWVSADAMFSASAPSRYYEDGMRELPAWSLQVNLKSIPVERAKMFFLAKLPAPFLSWVDSFLQEGSIAGDVMIFAFTKKRLPDTFATLLADLDIEGASLDYLPGKWPELNGVKANIKVTNDQVVADVPAANMFSTRLYNGKIFIESYLDENLPRVEVSGEASGALPDLQILFLESELKESIGVVVEDWVLHGEHKSKLELDIPLLADSQQKPAKIEISVDVDDALIAIPDVGLGVKAFKSKLHYSLQDGLSTDKLSALFFDKVVEGKIQTKDALGNQVIQISGSGSINAEDLQSWQDFWLFENLQGSTDFDAHIWIGELDSIDYLSPKIGEKSDKSTFLIDTNKQGLNDSYKAKQPVVRVDVQTSLENMAINLPGDYRKEKTGSAPSHMQLDILEDTLVYRMDYKRKIGVVAETRGQDFERARIHFSDGLYSLPASKGLVVTGAIESIDFDEWMDYISRHLLDDLPKNQPAESDQLMEDPAAIINRMDLSIGKFSGFGQNMNKLRVFVTREPFKWRLDLENQLVKGIIMVPDEHLITKQNPIIAKLDYLQLDESQVNAEQGVKASEDQVGNEAYVPEDFPFLNLDVASVRVGKTKHGRWRIDLHPDEKGMDFQVHQLNYGLMTINGKGRWDYSSENSVTHFEGHIRTSAVTRLFGALNLRPSSDSAGLMAIELKWPGSPMDFDYEKMQGKAGLKVFDGSIVEIDIKSKKFRALGIFNLGVLTDIITLRVFKKIGKGINEALSGDKE